MRERKRKEGRKPRNNEKNEKTGMKSRGKMFQKKKKQKGKTKK